jgi:hypothetical protein
VDISLDDLSRHVARSHLLSVSHSSVFLTLLSSRRRTAEAVSGAVVRQGIRDKKLSARGGHHPQAPAPTGAPAAAAPGAAGVMVGLMTVLARSMRRVDPALLGEVIALVEAVALGPPPSSTSPSHPPRLEDGVVLARTLLEEALADPATAEAARARAAGLLIRLACHGTGLHGIVRALLLTVAGLPAAASLPNIGPSLTFLSAYSPRAALIPFHPSEDLIASTRIALDSLPTNPALPKSPAAPYCESLAVDDDGDHAYVLINAPAGRRGVDLLKVALSTGAVVAAAPEGTWSRGHVAVAGGRLFLRRAEVTETTAQAHIEEVDRSTLLPTGARLAVAPASSPADPAVPEVAAPLFSDGSRLFTVAAERRDDTHVIRLLTYRVEEGGELPALAAAQEGPALAGPTSFLGHVVSARADSVGPIAGVDTSLVFPCAGRITSWSLCGDSGNVFLQVYRRIDGASSSSSSSSSSSNSNSNSNSNSAGADSSASSTASPPTQFRLVGQNRIVYLDKGVREYPVPEAEQIVVEEGDFLGLRIPDGGGVLHCTRERPGVMRSCREVADNDALLHELGPGSVFEFPDLQGITISFRANFVPLAAAAGPAPARPHRHGLKVRSLDSASATAGPRTVWYTNGGELAVDCDSRNAHDSGIAEERTLFVSARYDVATGAMVSQAVRNPHVPLSATCFDAKRNCLWTLNARERKIQRWRNRGLRYAPPQTVPDPDLPLPVGQAVESVLAQLERASTAYNPSSAGSATTSFPFAIDTDPATVPALFELLEHTVASGSPRAALSVLRLLARNMGPLASAASPLPVSYTAMLMKLIDGGGDGRDESLVSEASGLVTASLPCFVPRSLDQVGLLLRALGLEEPALAPSFKAAVIALFTDASFLAKFSRDRAALSGLVKASLALVAIPGLMTGSGQQQPPEGAERLCRLALTVQSVLLSSGEADLYAPYLEALVDAGVLAVRAKAPVLSALPDAAPCSLLSRAMPLALWTLAGILERKDRRALALRVLPKLEALFGALTEEKEEEEGTPAAANTAIVTTVMTEVLAQHESPHPYRNNMNDERAFHFPGAVSISLQFDPRSVTESGCDYLHVYTSSGPSRDKVHSYDGTRFPHEPVTVSGDTVVFQFCSDSSCVDWGFKVNLLAKVPAPKSAMPLAADLARTVASLIGIAAGTLARFEGAEHASASSTATATATAPAPTPAATPAAAAAPSSPAVHSLSDALGLVALSAGTQRRTTMMDAAGVDDELIGEEREFLECLTEHEVQLEYAGLTEFVGSGYSLSPAYAVRPPGSLDSLCVRTVVAVLLKHTGLVREAIMFCEAAAAAPRGAKRPLPADLACVWRMAFRTLRWLNQERQGLMVGPSGTPAASPMLHVGGGLSMTPGAIDPHALGLLARSEFLMRFEPQAFVPALPLAASTAAAATAAAAAAAAAKAAAAPPRSKWRQLTNVWKSVRGFQTSHMDFLSSTHYPVRETACIAEEVLKVLHARDLGLETLDETLAAREAAAQDRVLALSTLTRVLPRARDAGLTSELLAVVAFGSTEYGAWDFDPASSNGLSSSSPASTAGSAAAAAAASSPSAASAAGDQANAEFLKNPLGPSALEGVGGCTASSALAVVDAWHTLTARAVQIFVHELRKFESGGGGGGESRGDLQAALCALQVLSRSPVVGRELHLADCGALEALVEASFRESHLRAAAEGLSADARASLASDPWGLGPAATAYPAAAAHFQLRTAAWVLLELLVTRVALAPSSARADFGRRLLAVLEPHVTVMAAAVEGPDQGGAMDPISVVLAVRFLRLVPRLVLAQPFPPFLLPATLRLSRVGASAQVAILAVRVVRTLLPAVPPAQIKGASLVNALLEHAGGVLIASLAPEENTEGAQAAAAEPAPAPPISPVAQKIRAIQARGPAGSLELGVLEPVNLLRILLQAPLWHGEVLDALNAGSTELPGLVAALGSGGDSAADLALPIAMRIEAAVGTLAVLGGVSETVRVGGRVAFEKADGVSSHGTVLAIASSGITVFPDDSAEAGSLASPVVASAVEVKPISDVPALPSLFPVSEALERVFRGVLLNGDTLLWPSHRSTVGRLHFAVLKSAMIVLGLYLEDPASARRLTSSGISSVLMRTALLPCDLKVPVPIELADLWTSSVEHQIKHLSRAGVGITLVEVGASAHSAGSAAAQSPAGPRSAPSSILAGGRRPFIHQGRMMVRGFLENMLIHCSPDVRQLTLGIRCFRELDADGDGFITREDLALYLSSHSQGGSTSSSSDGASPGGPGADGGEADYATENDDDDDGNDDNDRTHDEDEDEDEEDDGDGDENSMESIRPREVRDTIMDYSEDMLFREEDEAIDLRLFLLHLEGMDEDEAEDTFEDNEHSDMEEELMEDVDRLLAEIFDPPAPTADKGPRKLLVRLERPLPLRCSVAPLSQIRGSSASGDLAADVVLVSSVQELKAMMEATAPAPASGATTRRVLATPSSVFDQVGTWKTVPAMDKSGFSALLVLTNPSSSPAAPWPDAEKAPARTGIPLLLIAGDSPLGKAILSGSSAGDGAPAGAAASAAPAATLLAASPRALGGIRQRPEWRRAAADALIKLSGTASARPVTEQEALAHLEATNFDLDLAAYNLLQRPPPPPSSTTEHQQQQAPPQSPKPEKGKEPLQEKEAGDNDEEEDGWETEDDGSSVGAATATAATAAAAAATAAIDHTKLLQELVHFALAGSHPIPKFGLPEHLMYPSTVAALQSSNESLSMSSFKVKAGYTVSGDSEKASYLSFMPGWTVQRPCGVPPNLQDMDFASADELLDKLRFAGYVALVRRCTSLLMRQRPEDFDVDDISQLLALERGGAREAALLGKVSPAGSARLVKHAVGSLARFAAEAVAFKRSNGAQSSTFTITPPTHSCVVSPGCSGFPSLQSQHPPTAACTITSNNPVTVSFQGDVRCLLVEFDPRSETADASQALRLLLPAAAGGGDASSASASASQPQVFAEFWGQPSNFQGVVVPGSRVLFTSSANSAAGDFWGWRLTVRPVGAVDAGFDFARLLLPDPEAALRALMAVINGASGNDDEVRAAWLSQHTFDAALGVLLVSSGHLHLAAAEFLSVFLRRLAERPPAAPSAAIDVRDGLAVVAAAGQISRGALWSSQGVREMRLLDLTDALRRAMLLGDTSAPTTEVAYEEAWARKRDEEEAAARASLVEAESKAAAGSSSASASGDHALSCETYANWFYSADNGYEVAPAGGAFTALSRGRNAHTPGPFNVTGGGSEFMTVVCGVKVWGGRWYYEATLDASGDMREIVAQIGFISSDFVYQSGTGNGVGDCKNSWAYDGGRMMAWHLVGSKPNVPFQPEKRWKKGDVVGVMLDVEARTLAYTLNGEMLGVAFTDVAVGTSSAGSATVNSMLGGLARGGTQPFLSPGLSLTTGVSVTVNLGLTAFEHWRPDLGFLPLLASPTNTEDRALAGLALARATEASSSASTSTSASARKPPPPVPAAFLASQALRSSLKSSLSAQFSFMDSYSRGVAYLRLLAPPPASAARPALPRGFVEAIRSDLSAAGPLVLSSTLAAAASLVKTYGLPASPGPVPLTFVSTDGGQQNSDYEPSNLFSFTPRAVYCTARGRKTNINVIARVPAGVRFKATNVSAKAPGPQGFTSPMAHALVFIFDSMPDVERTKAYDDWTPARYAEWAAASKAKARAAASADPPRDPYEPVAMLDTSVSNTAFADLAEPVWGRFVLVKILRSRVPTEVNVDCEHIGLAGEIAATEDLTELVKETDGEVLQRQWTFAMDEALVAHYNARVVNPEDSGDPLALSLADAAERFAVSLRAVPQQRFSLGFPVGPAAVARFLMLFVANRHFKAMLPQLDLSQASVPGTVAHLAASCRTLLFTRTKTSFLFTVMGTVEMPEVGGVVTVNRIKASRAPEGGNGLCTVFAQVMTALSGLRPKAMRAGRAFKVKLMGEGSEDYGGPYSEILSQIATELQSSRLPLFMLSPNGTQNVGASRERWIAVPSAARASPVCARMYGFAGRMLGVALRSKEALDLTLASTVWKALVKEPLDRPDLAAVDEAYLQALDRFRTVDRDHGVTTEEEFADLFSEVFTASLADGRVVELVPGGRELPVTFANRGRFADLAEEARLREGAEAGRLLREGLATQVYPALLSILSWTEVERLIVGAPEVDLDLLRKNTVFEGGYREDHPVILNFWSVLQDDFSDSDRRAFLRFAWGRSRLPLRSEDFEHKLALQLNNRANPDAALPSSHTCFFSLSLPPYTTREILRDRLLFAIHNTSTIDTDFNVAENSAWDI